jgi:hypothetical protein
MHLRTARFLVASPPPGTRSDAELVAEIDDKLEELTLSEGAEGGTTGAAATEPPSEPREVRPARQILKRPAAYERRARRERRERQAARADFEAGRYVEAREQFEAILRTSDPVDPVAREVTTAWIAACHLREAEQALNDDKEAAAIASLLAAADADPRARRASLYRDVGRLERRRALRAGAAGSEAEVLLALRRAFAADADDPKTLYLLSRRPRAGAGALDKPLSDYFQLVLRKRHPKTAQAVFYTSARSVFQAKSDKERDDVVGAYERAYPSARSLSAELRRLVAERRRQAAVRVAAQSRSRYEAQLIEADRAREDLLRRLRAEAPADPPDEAPAPVETSGDDAGLPAGAEEITPESSGTPSGSRD